MGMLNKLRLYVKNRWIHKTHQLTSKLEKGEWHDLDERILHCLFDSLVEFVEQETGMESLEWQSKLTGKDWGFAETSSAYNIPVPQALDAQEAIDLYHWWKEIRPKRPHANEVNEWNDYYGDKPDDEDTVMLIRLIKIRHFLWT